MTASRARIAVVGAGIAGATCARGLSDAGADVHLFEKSRGVGGRMATRRIRWRDAAQREHENAFDHGAPGFPVSSAAFAKFVDLHVESGDLVRWRPRMAPGSFVPSDGDECWLGSPRMPAVCSRLLDGLSVTLGCTVDAVRRDAAGWSLESSGETLGRGFAHVVLAMPPLQAAVLLAPHRQDWATRVRQQRMSPCWTLMGVTVEPAAADWDVAWSASGPLARIVRDDRKPGRRSDRGTARWVAHANPWWSETHLEAPDDGVRAALLLAMDECLGQRLEWRVSQVHRWRHASVAHQRPLALEPFWHDDELGLGVCGDHLGGAGVEGAWASGDALGQRIARACGLVPGRPGPAEAIPRETLDSVRRRPREPEPNHDDRSPP